MQHSQPLWLTSVFCVTLTGARNGQPSMSMYTVTLPGRNLAIRFQSLGDMSGKTLQEIVAVVGPPNARAGMGNNRNLYQWHATGYHIAILFDANNRAVKITSEHINVQDPDANDFGRAIGVVIGLIVLVLAIVIAIASH